MQKSTRFWTLGVGGGLVVAAMAGCAGEISRPTAAQLQEGLNFLDVKDPTWGMSAAFRKGDRVVYMETRVGPQMPEIYRQDDPDGPQNETDVRFVDASGHTFYAMRGGDNFVDPTWGTDFEASKHAKVDAAGRDLDFRLAREASDAFVRVAPATLKLHAAYFRHIAARPVPSEDSELRQRAAVIQPPDAPGARSATDPLRNDVGYAAAAAGDWIYIETDKYSGSTGCFAWICTAKHSATRTWFYYWNNGNSYWSSVLDANNHGRHYYDSGMGYNCYSAGGWFWSPYVTGSSAGGVTGNNDGQGGCQTAYNWNSGGWDHLCNDDAAYELWQAKSGGTSTTQGDAIGFTWTSNGHFACACQNNAGCDDDWNSPNCP
jgi:hypothetical protein